MATRFYINRENASYDPPTIRGTWNHAIANIVLTPLQLSLSKSNTGIQIVTLSTGIDTLLNKTALIRVVSDKLKAQTISGTVNVVIAVGGTSASARLYWAVHVYVTIGDTDIIRGTLVNNYVEDIPNNWATNTPTGKGFVNNLTLSPVTLLEGDRIVVELGFIVRVVGTPPGFAQLNYGTANNPDLTIGEINSIGSGHIDFSQDILLPTGDPSAVGHVVSQVARVPPAPPSLVGHVVTQVARIQPPAPSLVGHSVLQIARVPAISASGISHLVIQVVPTVAPAFQDMSGLYYLNPAKPFHHDSYYKSQEVKIPDPTIKTALLGE